MRRWMALIVLGLLSLVIWKQSKPTPVPKETRLSDGSRIRVYELAYGTNISFGKASIWQKLLGRLPSNLQPTHFRPPTVVTLQTPSTALLYSIVRPGTNSNNPLSFHWVDEHGFESSGNGNTSWSGLSGTNQMQARIFTGAPRRSKTIRLKIFDGLLGSESPELGEIVFQSPIQSTIPPFVAPPLPQTQQAGSVTVRLLDASHGLEYGQSHVRASIGTNERWTFLKLEMLSGVQKDTNWGITSITSSDATGNFLYGTSWGGQLIDGQYLFWFRDSLWPVEPIRYGLGITRQSNFPPNETLTISNVVIPAKGAFTTIGFSTNILGQRIDVEGFVDSGVVPPWRIDNRWNGSQSLHLTMPLLTKGTYVKILSVVDDLGQECPIQGSVASDSEYAYGVRFPKGGKTATIRLALQKSGKVEFTAFPHPAANDQEKTK